MKRKTNEYSGVLSEQSRQRFSEWLQSCTAMERKTTLRRMQPLSRKYFRLLNELSSVLVRLEHLGELLSDVEFEARSERARKNVSNLLSLADRASEDLVRRKSGGVDAK